MRTSFSENQTNQRQQPTRYHQNRSHVAPTSARLSWEQYSLVVEYREVWDRLALQLLRSESMTTPFTIGVTSSIRGEGKSTASIGLAVALAQESAGNVALIEANFRSRTLARDFGVENEPGLIDYLTGRLPLLEVSKATRLDQLTLFTAGKLHPAATGVRSGNLSGHLRQQFQEIMRQLGQEFSYVVLDLPPILGNVDAEEMLRFAQGTIVVVRSGATPLEKFRQATQRLNNRQLLGVLHLEDRSHIPRWLSRLMAE